MTDHQIFSRQSALESGFSPSAIGRRVRARRWRRLRAGVYVRCDPTEPAALADATGYADPGDRRQAAEHRRAVLAAIERIAAPVFASHESAAVLNALPLLRFPDRVTLTGRPVAAVLDAVSSRCYRDLRIFPAGIPSAQLGTVLGVPSLTPARVVVDMARQLPVEESLIVADAALRRGLVREGDFVPVLESCRGWPGIRRAARVVALADGVRESPLESLSCALFSVHGLVGAVHQHEIRDDRRRFVARVDFYWPGWGVVGEADGRLKYIASEAIPESEPYDRWAQERDRQQRIERAGYRVVRWTWAELRADPATVVRRVRQAMLLAVRDQLATVSPEQIAALKRSLFDAA